MTTAEHPKHLLPVAGVPSILRLLHGKGPLAAFSLIVITIAADDNRTLPTLLGENDDDTMDMPAGDHEADSPKHAPPLATLHSKSDASQCKLTSTQVKGQVIHVVKLSEDCFGPIDALRQVEATKIVDPRARMVVLPGDLVFLNANTFNGNNSGNVLDALIRPSSNTACISMLVDVLEQDEHGHPLKESAKVRITRS